MMQQSPSAILMVRPHHFGFNAETASSNVFQQPPADTAQVSQQALAEFDAMVTQLRAHHIAVMVVEDTDTPRTPDAVFPNNWISFHHNGTVVLYPMLSALRRQERRFDLIDTVRTTFNVSDIVDLSPNELEGKILEGTGSMVFDHVNRIGYANESERTNIALFNETCAQLGYEPVSFKATDVNGNDIYHTNVLLTIGEGFAVFCAESIDDILERSLVVKKMQQTGLEVIGISRQQMNRFAGNLLQVRNTEGTPYLIMSESAYRAFDQQQREVLEAHTRLLYIPIPTIEAVGGGSARCMMAGIHLPKKA